MLQGQYGRKARREKMSEKNKPFGSVWCCELGQMNSVLSKLGQKLGCQGAGIVQMLEGCPEYLDHVAREITNFYPEESPRVKAIRVIMKGNFFGIPEAIKLIGLGGFISCGNRLNWDHIELCDGGKNAILYQDQSCILEKICQKVADSHIMVFYPGCTAGEAGQALCSKMSVPGRDDREGSSWQHVVNLPRRGWYLFSKDFISGSVGKSWSEQLQLMGKNDAPVHSALAVYVVACLRRAGLPSPYYKTLIRCFDGQESSRLIVSGGSHPHHGSRGIPCAPCYYSEQAFTDLGLATIRIG
jgi:hypothetical protein